ncbi:MAG: hypothetical protein E5X89_01785 [Mesorhizobium sp.]|nr:MAG: hypothetical protein E5X88_04840 [Mesorhizobium sp.]TIO36754.1 MAG: hypothetical protein E5X89_01785 [Mesorhizobium sp.]TIP13785.1 MAG: hypothetical protein E5X73_06715 [Mesorhizobium sp.]
MACQAQFLKLEAPEAISNETSLRYVEIQVTPACKRLIPALPVLSYPKARSAPVFGSNIP